MAPATEPAVSASMVDHPVRELPEVRVAPKPAPTLLAQPVVDFPADDSDGPEWPDEAVEAAMRAEHREREMDPAAPAPAKPVKAARSEDAEESAPPLPKLEALIEQIPPAVRDTLEELFRARFTSVQRVPRTALK